MRRTGGRPAAFDGYASADAVAWGPTSVLFRVRGLGGRDDALKVFRLAGPQERAYARTSLLGDWRAWSRLAHAHVLPVADFGERNDSVYIARSWVDGPSLREVLDKRRTLELDQIRELAKQLAGALDAAAAVGLVHLDVKPENVLFAASDRAVHAYVTDFGAGSFAVRQLQDERSSSVQHTLEYAAPEQVEAGPVDRRATVYSLGCLLYEAITGATPYAGRSRDAAPPPALGGLDEVDRVFSKALARKRDERHATCTELADALCAALPRELRTRSARPTTRRRSLRLSHLTAAACLALVLSAGATAASWLREGAPSPPASAGDRAKASPDFFTALREREPTIEKTRKPLRVAPRARPKTAAGPAPSRVRTAKPERHQVPRRSAPVSANRVRTVTRATPVASPSVVPRRSSRPVSSSGAAGSPRETRTTAVTPPPLPPPPPPAQDSTPPPPPPPP